MRKSASKRDRLDRATKHTRRANPQWTWKQARAASWEWCVAMWPNHFESRR